MSVWVRISETGLLERTVAESPPTVSIQLPADAPVRALSDRASLFASATIAGSARNSRSSGFVFRNLRWDAETTVTTSRRRAGSPRSAAGRSPRRLAGERGEKPGAWGGRRPDQEAPAITRRRDVERFCSEVDALRDDLARCEKRLARAEAGDSRPVRPA